MTQTIGLVRGGLVINKIFRDSNKFLTDEKHNTKDTAWDTEKH